MQHSYYILVYQCPYTPPASFCYVVAAKKDFPFLKIASTFSYSKLTLK